MLSQQEPSKTADAEEPAKEVNGSGVGDDGLKGLPSLGLRPKKKAPPVEPSAKMAEA